MPHIVVTQDLGLAPHDRARLESLGKVTFYDTLARSYDDRLARCADADIICTGKYGLKQRYQHLHDVYISLPFVGVGFFDKDILQQNNITFSNAPGCNKDGVAEWIIYMLLHLFRKFDRVVNVPDLPDKKVPITQSLVNTSVCILGKGNIGSKVGNVCTALDMRVSYFTRGDHLLHRSKDADVVINCLTTNPTTVGLLNKEFFAACKQGAYFINVCDYAIYDIEALIEVLDSGHLAGAAIDAMGIQTGETSAPFYRKILSHPQIVATPHIARATDLSDSLGNRMMIDNIEEWLEGRPINMIS